MPSVRLDRVAFAYGPYDIFRDLSLILETGWTGVVGPNGGGKTTLLRLVSGELQASAGRVDTGGQVVHTCAQRADLLSPGIEELAWAWDRQAVRARAGLKLEPVDLEHWDSMSPGERKRWQLCAALYAEPEVLLLDEPSNHLDCHARSLLVDALRRFRGIGLLVSHDRSLLDALTERTIAVRRGQARLYRGPYSVAKQQWQEEDRHTRDRHARERSREKALRKRLADKRRSQAKAQRAIAASSRIKGPRDSDARSVGARARVMKGEARLSRSASLLRRSADDASARRAQIEVVKDRGRKLFVDYEPAPMNPVIALECRSLAAGTTTLLRDLRLYIDRGARIRITGGNGAGKTTLLRALLAAAGDRAEHMLYLPQELGPQPAVDPDQGTLDIAAALGADPSRLLASAEPSPGEQRKLLLARGLARRAWVLLLDEPTNHLDLPSIEGLQDALEAYPGAIVLVSHDETFARALTEVTYLVGKGQVQLVQP